MKGAHEGCPPKRAEKLAGAVGVESRRVYLYPREIAVLHCAVTNMYIWILLWKISEECGRDNIHIKLGEEVVVVKL